MSLPSLPMGKVAERLLHYETRENLTQATRRPAAWLVCEKLRPPLATLLGKAGFCALLGRALALANAEIAWTGIVRVNVDGTMDGWAEMEERMAARRFGEASETLIARLLGLLVTFVGEELTFRLLREIWPEISLHAGMTLPEDKP